MARHRWISTLGKYFLGLIVLAFVLWSHWRPKPGSPGPGLAEAFAGPIHWWPFVMAGVFSAVGLALTILRWWVLARALELPLPPREALRLGLLGYYFNTMLPGSIGGDLVKMATVVRSHDRRTAAVASIMIDRIIGLAGVVLLVVIVGGGYWLSGDPMLRERPALMQIFRSSCWLFVGIASAWLIFGWLSTGVADWFRHWLKRVPKLGGVASELWQAVWTYRQQRRATAVAMGLTLANHLCGVLAFHHAAQVFAPAGSDLPTLGEHLLLVPVGMTVKAIFPAPGGAGGGELIYGALYGWTGRSESLGVLGSLAILALAWLLGLIAYVLAISFCGANKNGPPDTGGPLR